MPFARRVDGRGQSGRAPADDDQIVEAVGPRRNQAQLLRQLLVARLDQHRAVGEDDRGHAAVARVEPLHLGLRGGVLIDVDIVVGDTVLAQELLAAAAVGAPGGAVDDQRLFLSHFGSLTRDFAGLV